MPANLTGLSPEAGLPGSVGTFPTTSVPNGPSRSSLRPPAPAISAAISARTSSHSPDRFGAANAWMCISLSW
jgi:hypothetical protein